MEIKTAEANLSGTRPRLRELNFGAASADYEASHDPDLLLSGFIDPLRLVQEAIDGRKFFFLGYKGSGKSALGEHLLLLSKSNPQLFVEFTNIADVSFTTFSQICKGAIEPEARYPMVWSWLLLLFLFRSFDRDQGSNAFEQEGLARPIRALKRVGLLSDGLSVKDLVNNTAEKGFSLKLNAIVGEVQANYKTAAVDSDFPFAVDRLRGVFLNARSASRHLLVIDGFDELLRRGTCNTTPWPHLSFR